MRVGVVWLALMIPINTAGGIMPEMHSVIKAINPYLEDEVAKEYAFAITKYAIGQGLDPKLIAAIVAVESAFKANARGTSGEVGLMQLMPKYHATHVKSLKERKKVLFEVDSNIYYGAQYVRGIKSVFANRYPKFRYLELYNRGPSSKPKTFPYTNRVLKYYRMFGGRV